MAVYVSCRQQCAHFVVREVWSVLCEAAHGGGRGVEAYAAMVTAVLVGEAHLAECEMLMMSFHSEMPAVMTSFPPSFSESHHCGAAFWITHQEHGAEYLAVLWP